MRAILQNDPKRRVVVSPSKGGPAVFPKPSTVLGVSVEARPFRHSSPGSHRDRLFPFSVKGDYGSVKKACKGGININAKLYIRRPSIGKTSRRSRGLARVFHVAPAANGQIF